MNMKDFIQEEFGIYSILSPNLVYRNFMDAVMEGDISIAELNEQINAGKRMLEIMHSEANKIISAMQDCPHDFGNASGRTQRMVMGDMRNSWRRKCKCCGMVERFSCMEDDQVAIPLWAEGVKLQFVG